MIRYINNNSMMSSQDPYYDDDYDAEEDYERYLDAMEDKYEYSREN